MSDYKLYLNKEEVIEEIKAESLYSELQKQFGGCGKNNNKFTLDQLKRIKEIVDENDGLD